MSAPFKTQYELWHHYITVIVPMAEAAGINPWKCVRYCDMPLDHHPIFNGTNDKYTFALTVLEGKPVFVGSLLWNNVYGYAMEVTGFADEIIAYKCTNIELGRVELNICTWTPPTKKRTFMLGGRQLNCPVSDECDSWFIVAGETFFFTTKEDRLAVQQAVREFLIAARDKE